MSPLARSLLALALAALLHAACARHPLPNLRPTPALPGRFCDTHEIGNATVGPSEKSVRVTQVFKTTLEEDEYLIDIANFCSSLSPLGGVIGVHYVMTRETVTVCAGTPVHVLDVGEDVFSPVVAVCDIAGVCGDVTVKVDQHCETRAVAPDPKPKWRPE